MRRVGAVSTGREGRAGRPLVDSGPAEARSAHETGAQRIDDRSQQRDRVRGAKDDGLRKRASRQPGEYGEGLPGLVRGCDRGDCEAQRRAVRSVVGARDGNEDPLQHGHRKREARVAATRYEGRKGRARCFRRAPQDRNAARRHLGRGQARRADGEGMRQHDCPMAAPSQRDAAPGDGYAAEFRGVDLARSDRAPHGPTKGEE